MPSINSNTHITNPTALQEKNSDAIVQAKVKGNARDGRTVTLTVYDPKTASRYERFLHTLSPIALHRERQAAKLLSPEGKTPGWKITVAKAAPKLTDLISETSALEQENAQQSTEKQVEFSKWKHVQHFKATAGTTFKPESEFKEQPGAKIFKPKEEFYGERNEPLDTTEDSSKDIIYENLPPPTQSRKAGHENPAFVDDEKGIYENLPETPPTTTLRSTQPEKPPAYEPPPDYSIEAPIYTNAASVSDQQNSLSLLPTLPKNIQNLLNEKNYDQANTALQTSIKKIPQIAAVDIQGRAFINMGPARATALQLTGETKYLPGNLLRLSPSIGSPFMAIGAPVKAVVQEEENGPYTVNVTKTQKNQSALWRLGLEKGSSTIVDLTNTVDFKKEANQEQDKKRLITTMTPYYPTESEPLLTLGTLTVKWESDKEVVPGYNIVEYTVTDTETGKTQTISRHHFTKWPDHGVPGKDNDNTRTTQENAADNKRAVAAFIKIKETIAQNIQDTGETPIVHCRAGVGRTGTFIMEQWLDAAFTLADKEGFPITTKEQLVTTIFQLLQQGRTQRNFAFVQKSEQLDMIIEHGETRLLGETISRWLNEQSFEDSASLESYFNQCIEYGITTLKLTHTKDVGAVKAALSPVLQSAKENAGFGDIYENL